MRSGAFDPWAPLHSRRDSIGGPEEPKAITKYHNHSRQEIGDRQNQCEAIPVSGGEDEAQSGANTGESEQVRSHDYERVHLLAGPKNGPDRRGEGGTQRKVDQLELGENLRIVEAEDECCYSEPDHKGGCSTPCPDPGYGAVIPGRQALRSLRPSQIDVLYRVPPPDPPEEPVPRKERWWREQVRGFVKWKREKSRVSEGWLRTMRQTLDDLPTKFGRAGVRPPPTGPSLVRLEHLRLLRERWGLSETYLAMNLTVLREFLRWSANPLANEPQEWNHAKPVATHRRWLRAEQLGALMRSARGRERVLVALEGYNGLRRVEVLRLHVRDLSFSMPPTMRVLGKGRFGGKPRVIPMSATAHGVLSDATRGLRPESPVYPHHPKTADRDLLAVAERAGLGVRVSGHDLRRSFGRIAYRNGVPLVDLRNLLGHETLDMTIHYVGVDSDEMAAGLERFERAMRESLTVPRQ